MSVAGVKVYNADGSLQFDSTARLFMTLDQFDTGTSAGSRTFQSPIAGVITTAQVDSGTPGVSTPPVVTVSGNTVSWTAGPSAHVRVVMY